MEKTAVFIDTSVLDNLLNVPGKNQDVERVQEDFLELQRDSSLQFVLPVTTVIETGNHIAQIQRGHLRRAIANKFGTMLDRIRESQTPWVLHDFEWGEVFLREFLNGADTGLDWVTLAETGIGGGDLAILVEASMYEERLKIKSKIWTYDSGLRSHAQAVLEFT